jgi:hypothetical protein
MAPTAPRRGRPPRLPRALPVVGLGLWVAASAWLWPHARPHLLSSLVAGLLVALSALLTVRLERARGVSLALGAWLFFAAFVLPGSRATVVNDALAGLAIVLCAYVPTTARRDEFPAGEAPAPPG